MQTVQGRPGAGTTTILSPARVAGARTTQRSAKRRAINVVSIESEFNQQCPGVESPKKRIRISPVTIAESGSTAI